MIIHNLWCSLKYIMHSDYVHRLSSVNDNKSLSKSFHFFCNITWFRTSNVLHVQCTWKWKFSHEFSFISIATWCRATTMIGLVILWWIFSLLDVGCSWTLQWKSKDTLLPVNIIQSPNPWLKNPQQTKLYDGVGC